MRRIAMFILSAGLLSAWTPGQAEPFALSWGKVHGVPEAEIIEIDRIARAVAEIAPAFDAGPSFATESLGALSHAMADGRVHLASETIFGALTLEREVGARILMRENRHGLSRYRSVVIVQADSAIQTLQDLRGRKIAFEDPGSTFAFFLPAAAIASAGLDLAPIRSIRSAPAGAGVSYAFVHQDQEQSIALAVATGLAAAGGFGEKDWWRLEESQPRIADRLRIMHETPYVTRAVLIAGPALPAALDAPLIAAIEALEGLESGRAVLRDLSGAETYDPIAGEAAEDLAASRALYDAFAMLIDPQ